jgi:hypothetical protein
VKQKFELVYRWRVEPGRQQAFFDAVRSIGFDSLNQSEIAGSVRLLQPALPPDPFLWELHIALEHIGDLGRALDWLGETSYVSNSPANPAQDVTAGSKDSAAPLWVMTDFPGAELLANESPLYRAWTLYPGVPDASDGAQ